MKTLQATFLLLLICNFVLADTDSTGIEFTNKDWKAALSEAKAQNKMVFLDLYTTWCKPCKWMEKEVFTDAEVAAYFNSRFINLSVDAEKEMTALVEKLDIEVFPTLLVFSNTGEVIKRHEGALNTSELITFAEIAIRGPEIEKNYVRDPSNLDFVIDYVKMIESEDYRKADSIANNYLSNLSDSDFRNPAIWKLIDPHVSYGSENSKHLMANLEVFKDSEGFDEYMDFFLEQMLYRAAKTEDQGLVDQVVELKVKVKKLTNALDREKLYYRQQVSYELEFYKGDYDEFARLVNDFVKDYYWNDPSGLIQRVNEISQALFVNRVAKVHFKPVFAWADRAIGLDDKNWEAHYSKAMTYFFIRDFDKAEKTGNVALKLAENEEDRQVVEELLASVDNEQ